MLRRRVVFNIGVIYQTSAEKVKKIPQIIHDVISAKEGATFDRSHFSGFGDFSLNFESVYYIEGSDYNIYMDIQQKIYLELFQIFEKEKIEFAYPTQTLFAANEFMKSRESVEEKNGSGKAHLYQKNVKEEN